MAKQTKASKEAEAVKKLDDSALIAQDRIQAAAAKAQKMIDDACEAATKALENTARVPDKRNLDGSFQWDRGDRYRRGSDDRMQRIEDKINGINKTEGNLNVGAAQRVEQIMGIRAEIKSLHDELDTKKIEMEHLANEITGSLKDGARRLDMQRDLITEVKAGVEDKIDASRDEIQKDKIRNQQYVIGIVVGLIVTFVTTLIMFQFHA